MSLDEYFLKKKKKKKNWVREWNGRPGEIGIPWPEIWKCEAALIKEELKVTTAWSRSKYKFDQR